MINSEDVKEMLVLAAQRALHKWYADNGYKLDDIDDEEEGLLDSYGNPRWGNIIESLYGNYPIVVNGFTVNEEDQSGGEGQGDSYYYVFSFTKGDEKKYFKLEAYYSSWEGVYWEDAEIREVFPREVVKIEWGNNEG